MPKRAENHHCEVNALGNLLVILAHFSRFRKGLFYKRSLAESEWSDRF